MKYSARLSSAAYLEINFDRQLSSEGLYRHWIKPGSSIRQTCPPLVENILDAIAATPGVLDGGQTCDTSFHAESIRIEGNEIKVKIIPLHRNGVAEICNQIVKKVQRRVAKGESRRRVTDKELSVIVATFNKTA